MRRLTAGIHLGHDGPSAERLAVTCDQAILCVDCMLDPMIDLGEDEVRVSKLPRDEQQHGALRRVGISRARQPVWSPGSNDLAEIVLGNAQQNVVQIGDGRFEWDGFASVVQYAEDNAKRTRLVIRKPKNGPSRSWSMSPTSMNQGS